MFNCNVKYGWNKKSNSKTEMFLLIIPLLATFQNLM